MTLDQAIEQAGRLLDAQAQRIEDTNTLRMVEAGVRPEDVAEFTNDNRAAYAAWRPGALAQLRGHMLEA